ncbi:polycystin-2-like [Tribolium madens]|uniref:polycystin-2-like n=1 Tax=Tribolium madens TaxID=41895 RepID=UPI001CF7433C|nr:polycystin-2-like [Tribolium madens]
MKPKPDSPEAVIKATPDVKKKEGTNKDAQDKTDAKDDKPDKAKDKGAKSEPKETKVRWLTRAMAEDFTRQDVLFTTFREAVLYIIFVVAVTICTVGRRSASMFYITQALKGQFLEKHFQTANEKDINYKEIRSATDFWHYTQSLMLENFYWEHYYNPYNPVSKAKEDDKKILFENKLLGVPRIRQVKVKNDSCIIHEYFRRLFLTCYDLYGPADEDREPFGLGTGTAWTYNTAAKTESIPFSGKISKYEGGGFYQDLSTNSDETGKIIRDLKENLWITRGTRAIFIDFSIYNANLNLFCVCKLIFEFPPTGGILPSHSFHAVHLIHYVNSWDYVTFVFECTVYAIAGFFLAEEIREIIYFKLRYFLQFWTYIDVIIIGMAFANLITSIVVFPNVDDAILKIQKNPKQYGNLEYLAEMRILYNNFAASLLFFSYIKLFKYLNFNKTMGQLNNTLKRCAFDILGFSIMFFIIFFAFALLGYLLFGSQVEDFSSFGVAMFTLLRTILGDFDYQAIEKANRVLAPIYFLAYIFFVFFVLLNMFLAIINDTYADVKTEIAIAPDEMQMTEFLKKGFYKMLQKCGCNIKYFQQQKAEFNATIQQIRDALKKCGFSDLEIEMFFARYNIDPLAEVGDYDIKKIMKELEGQSMAKEKVDEDTTLVHVSDFITQQERLDQIEKTIQMLATKIDTLIKKLEALENVRKTKATQG